MKCSSCPGKFAIRINDKVRCRAADCTIGTWEEAECCYTAEQASKLEHENMAEFIEYTARVLETGEDRLNYARLRVMLEKEEQNGQPTSFV